METTIYEAPVFVIGNPRSGTSLLRLTLTSHSAILIPPECGFIVWLEKYFGDWNTSDNKTAKVDGFLDALFKCKKFETWSLSPEFIRERIEETRPANYSTLCSVVYSAYGLSLGKKFSIWGDKNNFYLQHLEELLELFPNARFLHIVRDGRDVACSYREVMRGQSNSPYAPHLETNIRSIAHEWSSNVSRVNNFIEALPPDSGKTVKYEELAQTPDVVLGNICAWFGLSFEKDMLRFHDFNRDEQLEPKLTMDWKKRTLEPISNGTVGRFEKLLTISEIDEFNAEASVTLSSFGYA